MRIRLSLTFNITRDRTADPAPAESDAGGPRIWDMSNGHHERAAQHDYEPEPARPGSAPRRTNE